MIKAIMKAYLLGHKRIVGFYLLYAAWCGFVTGAAC